MSTLVQGRPIAPLPQTVAQHPIREHRAPQYIPSNKQLEPGPRNQLILALRSGIPEEVDYALPRLIVGSYDQPERFLLDKYIDAVPALLEWPNAWLDDLERAAALQEARRSGKFGYQPEWKVDPGTEERAVNSLLVLRNATFAGNAANSRFIASGKAFVAFVTRLFALPLDYLLDEVLLSSPEPIQHTLVVLQSVLPCLKPTPPILHLLSTTLPEILIHTRDLTILHLILPLLISALLIPSLPPLPPALTPHLVLLLSLSPPPTVLDLTLDLLISLTLSPGPARLILASPNISAHLRHLMRLLEHGSRQTSANFEPPAWTMGGMAPNPASPAWAAEEASRKRGAEREEAQKRIEEYGSGSVMEAVGDRLPQLADNIKAKLFKLKEPERSIKWMHESFVYSSMSQLLQVTFWHSYRDFFNNSQVSDQLLSASEVIKNVTVAFPGAAAKVWVDEGGTQRFVVAGIGFRKSTEDIEKYACKWTSCPNPTGATNPTQLLSHITSAHIFASQPQPSAAVPPSTEAEIDGDGDATMTIPAEPTASTSSPGPTACAWASCTHPTCTTSHILTHLPLPRMRSVPDMVLSNPNAASWLSSQHISSRPAPRLPPTYKLHFAAFSTPTDARTRHPLGVAFLSALLIRNLAKVLRSEINAARRIEGMAEEEVRGQKRKREDKFGLPIPDTILKEEEEEEKAAAAQGEEDVPEEKLNWEERERARMGFEALEERLGEVFAQNLSGLGQYLGEAWGW